MIGEHRVVGLASTTLSKHLVVLHERIISASPFSERFKALDPHQVLSAVDALGYECTGRLLALNSYENRVYQIETEEGVGIIAKFYRPVDGHWTPSRTSTTLFLNLTKRGYRSLVHSRSPMTLPSAP